MAAPRPQRSTPARNPRPASAHQPDNAAAAKKQKGAASPDAASSKKDDLQPWITNKDHPRFGDDWQYYINLIRTDFLNQQTLKNALKLAKAWSHFCQAALGVGKLPPVRSDVMPEQGDVPDVAERFSKSAAGEVSTLYFSYDNPFSNHWDFVLQQMAQGAASTYRS